MKRSIFPALLAICLPMLLSCDIFLPADMPGGRTVLVAVGLGYNKNEQLNGLENTANDFNAVVDQFEILMDYSGLPYSIITYSDFDEMGNGQEFTFSTWNGDEGERTQTAFTPFATTKEGIVDDFFLELSSRIDESAVVEDDDLIIFYFAGHGTEDEGPVIHHSDGMRQPLYTAFSYVDLENKLLGRYSSRALVILDCCHSGWAISNDELADVREFRADGETAKVHSLSFPERIADAIGSSWTASTVLPERMYLTSSGALQESYDSDVACDEEGSENYGAFTYRLLQALGYDTVRGEAAIPISFEGRTLTASALFSAIKKNMTEETYITATPSMTKSRYDMVVFDFRRTRRGGTS